MGGGDLGDDGFTGTDRFRVLRELGGGAMGIVYEADDTVRGQRVALKTLKRIDSDSIYRMKQEFRALADIGHPNLVDLYDLVSDGERCFFTMELVPGEDIVKHVRGTPTGQGYDEQRLRRALPQLVQGLMALHRGGQIHRDVKPSNVLVTRDGRVVIVDFGLATTSAALGGLSQEGGVVGTAPYMSPEQASGEARVGPASDWYAVGVILYECLTGKLPFSGSVYQILMDKQEHPAPPPRAILPEVPPDLDALVEALLAREPEARPRGPAILRRLGVSDDTSSYHSVHESSSSLGSVADVAPFAGRSEELRVLGRMVDRVEGGRAGIVLVHGPSGIGKSALVRQLVRGLRKRREDAVVLEGRCYERELVPFKAIDGLVDVLAKYWRTLPLVQASTLLPREAALLPRLFPVLARVPAVAQAPRVKEEADPQAMQTRAYAAFRELFQRLAARYTVVAILDDMQWVDPDTVALLTDLMRAPDPPSILLLMISQTEGIEPLQTMMSRMEGARRVLELGRLEDKAAQELAVQLVGTGNGDMARRAVLEAEGNPLFLVELSRYLQEAGEGPDIGRVRLEDVLTHRVTRLGGTARRVLQVVAVAGEPVPRSALQLATELDKGVLARELRLLRTNLLVRTAAGRSDELVECYHDRIRRLALGGVGADDKTAIHRALALGLGQDAPAESLARHWHGAGDMERAAEHAMRAAREAAATLDFSRAAGLYRMALSVGSFSREAERELREALGDAYHHAGRSVDMAEAFSSAADMWPAGSAERLDLSRRAAEGLLRGGYLERGLAAMRAVLEENGLSLAATPARALSSLLTRRAWLAVRGLSWKRRSPSDMTPHQLTKVDLCWSIATSLSPLDPVRGTEFHYRHLLGALELGDPVRAVRAIAMHSSMIAIEGSASKPRKVLAGVRDLAASMNDAYAQACVEWAEGSIAFFAENAWRRARDSFDQVVHLFREGAKLQGWELDVPQLWGCFTLIHLGDVAELSRLLPAYVRRAERRGDRYATVNLRARIPIVWLARGDSEAALHDVNEAMSEWTPIEQGFHIQHYYALHSRSEIAVYRGEPAPAWADQEAHAGPLKRSLYLLMPLLQAEWYFLRGRVAASMAATQPASERPRWLAETRAYARRLTRVRQPMARPMSTLLEASAAITDQHVSAVDLLRRAAAESQALDMHLYASAAIRRLGQLLAGTEGAALVTQSEAWMLAQGIRAPDPMVRTLIPA